MRRRLLAKTIPLALTILLMAVLSPTASAAPANKTTGDSIAFQRQMAPNGANGTQDDPEYIFCFTTADAPSGGGDDVITGTGWAACTWTMYFISIRTQLIRDNVLVASEQVTLPGLPGFGVHARTTQCVVGNYTTVVTVQYVPPSGYFPPSWTELEVSPTRFIDCRVHLPNPPQCPPSCALGTASGPHAVRETA